MSSFDSNHKSIIAKPRKKRSLKTTSSGLDSLPEILKQELTTTKEIKKTSLRLRKNHNNTTTDTNNDNNNNDLQVEKVTSRKRSIRASSKAIVQRTEQTDDVLEQATIAQTIEEPALEELVKKPRKKRKLKPQNNPIPNSTLLSGDELALEGHDDSGLSVYLNTSSPQPTPVTLGTPQKKRKMISKFRTPSPPPPPSRSQSPPSTPQRLALSTVLSDLDLSKHTILPDLSYVVHMRDSKEESDSECNDESDINHDDVQALLFDTFPTRSMEEEAEYESDTSSVYFDAMSDIEEGEKT